MLIERELLAGLELIGLTCVGNRVSFDLLRGTNKIMSTE